MFLLPLLLSFRLRPSFKVAKLFFFVTDVDLNKLEGSSVSPGFSEVLGARLGYYSTWVSFKYTHTMLDTFEKLDVTQTLILT
jgi:hypothetical protein